MYELFYLTPNEGGTLQQQLREQIAKAILKGNIPVDIPLPSSRRLSKQLNVARNTVVLAYEHLLDDGFLIARERCGYYVNPNIISGHAEIKPELNSPCDISDYHPPDWLKLLKLYPSNQKNIVKPNDWHKYTYPFIYGQFDDSMFPTVNWRECCRDAVSGPSIKEWAGDRMDRDDPLLIEQIKTRLLPRRGVWASEDEILVTVGAQQSLYMLAQLLLDKDSTIGLENPGYVDIRNIVKLRSSHIKAIPVDEGGLIVGDELKGCDLVYTKPPMPDYRNYAN